MLKFLGKLGHELENIRATRYLEEVPLQRKLNSLEQMHLTEDSPYSMHELYGALGVARGTFTTIFSAMLIGVGARKGRKS